MKEIFKNLVKVISPFIFGIFMTAMSLSTLLPYMASKHQVFKDIILETTALKGFNKSGEMLAVWISLLIGGLSIFIFKYFEDKKNISVSKENVNLDFIGIGIILIPSVFILFFKQEINFYLVIIGIVYYITYFMTNKDILLTKKILMLLISLYLFSMSLKAVLDKILKNFELISRDMILPLTIILFIYFIIILKKKNFLDIEKKILLFQIPAPLILLTFLTNKYLLNGKVYKISQLTNYKLIIILLIMALLGINILQYRKRKSNTFVLFSSVIIIFILHYYDFSMNIDYGDFWHVGEYTNPWHQIVNKKMKLFVDYNGTSGLYGLVTGFFQNVVLDGTALSYHSAVSLVRIFWALIIGSSCYFLVKDFALILPFFNYTIYPNRDRSVALLALLLILLLPKLIKNRIRWVQIYLIFSLFLFFYYPLNGVAFALGLFPFAIVQLYVTYKRNIWRKEMKSFTFWGLNIILLGSLIFLYKFIIGMLKNVFLLSSQTMLADGIAVYNYSIPSYWFLKFLKDDTLRKNMWYIYVCLVTLSVILIFWYLIYYYFQKYKGKSLISKLDSPIFLILFSSSIIIPINYTFTFIRMERNIEFSRTTGTMVIALGFLLNILLYRYGKKLFSNNLKIIFIGLTLGFVSLINGDSRGSEVDVLKKNYEVSKNFVYVNGKEIGLPKLGKGFIEKKDLSSLKIIKENVDKLVSDKENFWPSSRRELLYILDKKVPVKIDSMKLTKSLKASKENIKMLEKNPPAVILDLMNYESYYTYRWILDYGYVMYVDRGETFWVRPDIYEKKLGNLLEARKNTLDKFSSQEIEKIPYSLGNSIKTLSGIFSQKKEINTKDLKLEYNQINNIGKNKFSISNKKDPFFIVDLPENISGKDFDFMLIDLSSNYSEEKLKKLKIQFFLETTELPFYENRTLRFDYGNGKLLVPVGIHPAWLYSNMTRVRVDFENSVPGMEFRINKIEFLKLNLDRKE